jgi:hypothetical protein
MLFASQSWEIEDKVTKAHRALDVAEEQNAPGVGMRVHRL